MWCQRGATKDSNGLWRSHDGMMVGPESFLTMFVSECHGVDHCGPSEVGNSLNQQA